MSVSQKTKLLYIKQILERYTDANHDLTQAQIQEKLEKQGYAPKARTLHDDLFELYECQDDFSIKLENNVKPGKDKAHTLRYKITKRLFSPTEVKVLMESVSALHSLGPIETNALINKLSSLCSDAEAKEIKNHLAVVGGFKPIVKKKTGRYSTLKAIEAIDKAIAQDAKLEFRYFWYSTSLVKSYWKNKCHIVSPLTRVLEGGYHYLIATDDTGELRHFRIDRMIDTMIIEEKREATPYLDYSRNDWKDYVNSTFGMGLTNPNLSLGRDAGPTATNLLITASIKFTRDLVGVVLDRFGSDVILAPMGKAHFVATFHAYQNVQFLTWLVSLGNKIQIISPQALRKDISRFARKAGRWHYFNKSVSISEYSFWEKRKPYWADEEDLSKGFTGDETWESWIRRT